MTTVAAGALELLGFVMRPGGASLRLLLAPGSSEPKIEAFVSEAEARRLIASRPDLPIFALRPGGGGLVAY